MENTLENKAKFFAQYWGQKVLIYTESSITHVQYLGASHMTRSGIKGRGLLLEPLSAISDEDAMEVAEKQFPVQPLFKKLDKDLILSDTADYLRSKGYAIPFHDITVEQQIEYGWIKLKGDK